MEAQEPVRSFRQSGIQRMLCCSYQTNSNRLGRRVGDIQRTVPSLEKVRGAAVFDAEGQGGQRNYTFVQENRVVAACQRLRVVDESN